MLTIGHRRNYWIAGEGLWNCEARRPRPLRPRGLKRAGSWKNSSTKKTSDFFGSSLPKRPIPKDGSRYWAWLKRKRRTTLRKILRTNRLATVAKKIVHQSRGNSRLVDSFWLSKLLWPAERTPAPIPLLARPIARRIIGQSWSRQRLSGNARCRCGVTKRRGSERGWSGPLTNTGTTPPSLGKCSDQRRGEKAVHVDLGQEAPRPVDAVIYRRRFFPAPVMRYPFTAFVRRRPPENGRKPQF